MSADNGVFAGFVVLELFGHRRLAGHLTEVELAGAKFLRLDIPRKNDQPLTQVYNPSAVYAITPCTEEVATGVALANQPQPVYLFEMPKHGSLVVRGDDEADGDDGYSYDSD